MMKREQFLLLLMMRINLEENVNPSPEEELEFQNRLHFASFPRRVCCHYSQPLLSFLLFYLDFDNFQHTIELQR